MRSGRPLMRSCGPGLSLASNHPIARPRVGWPGLGWQVWHGTDFGPAGRSW